VINEDPDTEEGIVEILGTDQDGIDPEVGSVYEVEVIKILDFGAVVEYVEARGNEVLLHVSELAWERTDKVTDIVNLGDVLDVKYFGLDPRTRKEKVSPLVNGKIGILRVPFFQPQKVHMKWQCNFFKKPLQPIKVKSWKIGMFPSP
uniref:S1 motif domain-containing protein n=1 Tax=Hippocampus comes TaxID=109280 RepID=A0A3Q2ZPD4_HIPCM